MKELERIYYCLISEREDIKSKLGMDWLQEFNSTIINIEKTTTISDQSEKDKKVYISKSCLRQTEQSKIWDLKYN